MRALALVFVLAGVGCAHADAPSIPAVTAAGPVGTIDWRSWSPATFEQAAQDDKMLLVDVGMEGCTACRWMDEDTYTDPEVIARINQHFIPVSVDSEARPDVGERYLAWGWPATIVMAPDGEQVLAVRGNKRPKNFVPILDALIDAKAAGTLTGDGKTPVEPPNEPEDAALAELQARVSAQIDKRWDEAHAGWGAKFKSPKGSMMEFALLRAHTRGNDEWRQRALRSLDGWRELIDPVWGGMFVASIGGGWTSPIPEKRTRHQAAALLAFANAHRLTGEVRWLRGAEDIDRYLAAFMIAEDGTFFTSQEDDAPRLSDGLSALDYYRSLDDAQRRAYGVPPVDHAVYTDRNALVIRAYAELYAATGEARWRTRATKAADALLARQTEQGVFEQFVRTPLADADDRMRQFPPGDRIYLRPQGPMGLALLALSNATGEVRYRDAALRLAVGLRATLEDKARGGFFATDDGSMDHIAPRRKPIEENASAAQFLYLAGVLSADDGLRDAAERALRAVAVPKHVRAEGIAVGQLALALELLATGAVEISVVGAEVDPTGAEALFAAARALYEPRKVLHHQAPGRYPATSTAAVFICNDVACSSPIRDPAALAGHVANFARP